MRVELLAVFVFLAVVCVTLGWSDGVQDRDVEITGLRKRLRRAANNGAQSSNSTSSKSSSSSASSSNESGKNKHKKQKKQRGKSSSSPGHAKAKGKKN
ncbi:tetratricopeptide repeat protein 14-like [Lineus longissimus]|uniref:tetratricopeptide repeat protein 14-like n=1 Tax=Lineus longissimus TaxID=88925 RepID=UPI002B4CB86C